MISNRLGTLIWKNAKNTMERSKNIYVNFVKKHCVFVKIKLDVVLSVIETKHEPSRIKQKYLLLDSAYKQSNCNEKLKFK